MMIYYMQTIHSDRTILQPNKPLPDHRCGIKTISRISLFRKTFNGILWSRLWLTILPIVDSCLLKLSALTEPNSAMRSWLLRPWKSDQT